MSASDLFKRRRIMQAQRGRAERDLAGRGVRGQLPRPQGASDVSVWVGKRLQKRIFIELMASDRQLEAPREGSK